MLGCAWSVTQQSRCSFIECASISSSFPGNLIKVIQVLLVYPGLGYLCCCFQRKKRKDCSTFACQTLRLYLQSRTPKCHFKFVILIYLGPLISCLQKQCHCKTDMLGCSDSLGLTQSFHCILLSRLVCSCSVHIN